jgi:hypothetical protein
MIEWKAALGLTAAVLAGLSFIPYIHSILKGKAAPHFFTWLLWAILSCVIYAIQLSENAGPGAWSMGVTALGAIVIAVLSFFRGEKTGTKMDWACLISCLFCIPLWLITKDPTASAVLLTVIDVVAFWPTVSKTWKKPHKESLVYYSVWMIRYPMATFAITEMSLANVVCPAAWAVISFFFVGMIVYRRAVLAAKG